MATAREEESPAEKEALELAIDVASQVRRMLDGLRTFPAGHQTLKAYFDSLHQRLTGLLVGEREEAPDEYALGVTPLGFKWGRHVLNAAESLADSFTHPLYLDGVHQLVFSRGVTLEELNALADIWRATLDNRLGDTHTFCTRFWEADLAAVHVIAAETFSEGTAADANRPRSELQLIVDGFSGLGGGGEALVGTSGIYTGSVSRVSRITRQDLDKLRATGIPEMTPEDLARYDAGERAAVAALSQDELARLANELATLTSQQIERATEAMFQSGVRASPEELVSLRRAFALVVSAMLKQGMIGRLRDALNRRVSAARVGDPAQLAARFEVLAQLMSCLLFPVVLEHLVLALDHEEQAEAAVAVLRFLPAQSTSRLLEWLPVLESEKGRRVLLDMITTQKPAPSELVQRMGWADEVHALELLHIAVGLGQALAWPVRKAAFAHPALAVRKAAVWQLPKEIILAHRAELAPLLASADAAVRTTLFAPLMSNADASVATALSTLLRQVPLDDTERRRVIVALGTLGGPDASAALCAEFTTQRDVDLKCACAGALGHAGDEKARALLAEAAGKVFGGGELKKAAGAALKRLEQRLGARKRP